MDPAYIEILDTNTELRKDLAEEIANNKASEKRICALIKEVEACYRTISQQDSTILEHEKEIASLKSEISSLKRRLYIALQDASKKEEHLISRDSQLQELEEKIIQLRNRIKELSVKSGSYKKSPLQEVQMAVPDLLANIRTALDRVEVFIGGDTSIDPIATLNGIRITLTRVRDHIQTTAQNTVNLQNVLRDTNTRVNNLMTQMTNERTDSLRREQMMTNAWRDERRTRQQRDEEIIDLRHMVCENVYEKCWWRRRYNACAQQAQNLKRHYRNGRADIGLLEYNRDRLFDRYLK